MLYRKIIAASTSFPDHGPNGAPAQKLTWRGSMMAWFKVLSNNVNLLIRHTVRRIMAGLTPKLSNKCENVVLKYIYLLPA